jgi:dynein heavy chain 1, cytosolic
LIQQPSWLGLPNNAEIVLLTTRARETLGKLLKMSSIITNDEDDLVDNVLADQSLVTSNEKKSRPTTMSADVSGDSRPVWMKQLHQSCLSWLKLLPSKVTTMRRTNENIKDPLFRFFEREVNTGSKLLANVQSDLRDISAVCETKKKQTNYHRQLISDLIKGRVHVRVHAFISSFSCLGVIPSSWKRYTIPKNLTVMQWITDFSDRVKQLESISKLVADQGYISLRVRRHSNVSSINVRRVHSHL